jgi:hypothetical protein
MNGIAWLSAAICAATVSLGAQAPMPDFSGRWRIDDARSGRGVEVWGQTRARVLTITQTPAELQVTTDGGGPSAPGDLQRYALDGRELIVRDDSVGELPNFVRKVRTLARWDGASLTTETETISESVDKRSGAPKVARGITSVLIFRLDMDGDQLIVERTGFRAVPPPFLLGRPYDRDADFAYNVDVVRYVRVHPTER